MSDQNLSSLNNQLSQYYGRMLVVAPHHDDESIGVGGTIADFCKRGGEIHAVTVFSGESGIPHSDPENAQKIRKQELSQAAKILGITQVHNLTFADRCSVNQAYLAKALIPVIRNVRPEIVITPHIKERDPEHVIVAKAVRQAVWLSATEISPNFGKACPRVKMLLGYEVWTPIEKPQLYIDITHVVDIKLKAIAMHRSQVTDRDWVLAAKGLARYRGVTSGYGRFVEAFELYSVTSDILWPWFLENSTRLTKR